MMPWLKAWVLLEKLATDALLQALKNFVKLCNNLLAHTPAQDSAFWLALSYNNIY